MKNKKVSNIDKYASIRKEWNLFYKCYFNRFDILSQVVIPPKPTHGKWRLLFIPKGMTLDFACEICSRNFKFLKCYDDLDYKISKNARNTSNTYAIWVRDEVEPDKEFLGKSLNKTDPHNKIGITLLERIILEIKYFSETGKHLDLKRSTICSGSVIAGGGILCTSYEGGQFKVIGIYVGNFPVPFYGIRSVVVI